MFFLAKKKNIFNFPLVDSDFLQHKKNIIYKAYVDFLNNNVLKPDSSVVESIYKKGLKDSLFFNPKQALIKSLNFKTKNEADSVFVLLNEGVAFDSFLSLPYQSSQTKTIKKGSKGVLGDAAFSLQTNSFSNVINNTDKTFSIIKVVGFKNPTQKPFFDVYNEIEKKHIKDIKKENKRNIYKNLKEKYSFSFNFLDLL